MTTPVQRLVWWLGTAVSVLLAGVALTRATSYLLRPPDPSASTELIEAVIAYHLWGCILVAAAALVCVGVVTRGALSMWTYFVGHVVLVGCYSIFGLSILIAAVITDAPWTSLGEVVAVAIGHTSRVLAVVLDTPEPRERDR